MGLVIADVSGKAMRGAMNAAHTSTIVQMAAEDAIDYSAGARDDDMTVVAVRVE